MASANNIKFQVGDEVFEPTGELLEQYLTDKEASLQLDSNKESQVAAKLAVIEKLGLTAEEVTALLA
jgi:hypothetical protein